jgi:TolB-like protein
MLFRPNQDKPTRIQASAPCRCIVAGYAATPHFRASVPAGLVRRSDTDCDGHRFVETEKDKGDAEPKDGGPKPCVADIQRQLSLMLQSKIFAQSGKLSRFLTFIVEHTASGNPGCLKEYVIGSEVYERKPPYHPSQDSIVRTEARRLRNKLREYYESEGNGDPVYIYIRPGSYIPVFQYREGLIGEPDAVKLDVSISAQRMSPIAIAVLPFRDVSVDRLATSYAPAIAEELAYALMHTPGCSVLSPTFVAHCTVQDHDVLCTMARMGAALAYEGSVRTEGGRLRVTARIIDTTGLQLWLKRIDLNIESGRSFATEEQIAMELAAGFHAATGNASRMNVLSIAPAASAR